MSPFRLRRSFLTQSQTPLCIIFLFDPPLQDGNLYLETYPYPLLFPDSLSPTGDERVCDSPRAVVHQGRDHVVTGPPPPPPQHAVLCPGVSCSQPLRTPGEDHMHYSHILPILPATASSLPLCPLSVHLKLNRGGRRCAGPVIPRQAHVSTQVPRAGRSGILSSLVSRKPCIEVKIAFTGKFSTPFPDW